MHVTLAVRAKESNENVVKHMFLDDLEMLEVLIQEQYYVKHVTFMAK